MGLIFCRAVFDRDVLARNEARFLQALPEGGDEVRGVSERGLPEKTNNGQRRLLRTRRDRPRRRSAAEQRDELPPLHARHGAPPPVQESTGNQRARVGQPTTRRLRRRRTYQSSLKLILLTMGEAGD